MNSKENIMKKSVTFQEEKNKLYVLVQWNFAYKQARKCEFRTYYLDRLRFEKRINNCKIILDPILSKEHRTKMYLTRFANTCI